jgi:hypothetical protein
VSGQSPGLAAVAAVVFVVCLIGLVFFIVKLVAGNRADVLASAPLTAELQLTLEFPGPVVVMIEAPRVSTDYRNFEIQLLDLQSKQVTTLKYSYATAQGGLWNDNRSGSIRAFRGACGRISRPRPRRHRGFGLLRASTDSVATLYGPHGDPDRWDRAVRHRHARQCDLGLLVDGLDENRMTSRSRNVFWRRAARLDYVASISGE